MTNSSLLLVLTSTIVIAGLAGLILFIASVAAKKRVNNYILESWALGFFLITWIRIPTLMATAGSPISETVEGMTPFFIVAGMAMIAGHALFLRGVLLQKGASRIWTNTFPLLAFLFVSIFIGVLNALNAHPIISIYITSIFILTNVIFLVYSNALCLKEEIIKRVRIGFWLSTVGWTIFFFSHIYITYIINKYPIDLWFFALSASPTVYIYAGYTISYILLLIGIVLSHTNNNQANIKDENS